MDDLFICGTKRRAPVFQRIVSLAAAAVLLAAQFVFRTLAQTYLMPAQTVPVLRGVLRFHYVENTGVAFGRFGENPAFMWAVTGFTGLILLFLLVAMCLGRVRRGLPTLFITLIMAGGIGIFAERFAEHYVVDYFEFLFVNFAIFNFADCLISLGAFGLLIWMLAGMRTQKREPNA
ncbi:MAG: signal peptidase II [Oscillospiraceae bacterium]|jgi:signal peptidase II|nr:signal peptidase II [Oscillospiraceae bacterium]